MVTLGPSLDIAALLSVGPGALGRRAFLAELPAFTSAQERVRTLGPPAVPDEAWRSAATEAAGIVAPGRPIVVAGLPEAARAVSLAARLSCPWADVRAVCAPDAERAARFVAQGALWVVIEGAYWADDLAEWLVSAGAPIAVVGEGQHAAPPRGWWIDDARIADGTWAALGAAARFVVGACGADPSGFAEAEAVALQRLRAAPLLENGAASLALACTRGADALGLAGLASVADSDALRPLAEWFAGAWDASLGASTEDASARRTWTATSSGQAQDAAVRSAVRAGDRLLVLWSNASASGAPASVAPAFAADPTGAALWSMCAAHAVPRVRVRAHPVDVAQVAATVAFGAMTVAYGAALRGAPSVHAPDTAWEAALRRVSVDDDGPAA